MLEKPPIPDDLIRSRLRAEFGLDAAQVAFLPLGADVNTAVYRVSAPAGEWFLKLRSGPFDPASVRIPLFLKQQGIGAVIAPVQAQNGQPWGRLDAPSGAAYRMILYPFVEGEDAYTRDLSERQWAEFGAALKAIHAADLPDELARLVPREAYATLWRKQLRAFQAEIERTGYADPVAARLSASLRERRGEVDFILARAEALAAGLQARPLPFVLCHADIHPGNLLVTPPGALFIVDWDAPIQAPKERDLMFIGGGISSRWNTPSEEALFYRGYGAVEIDRPALAYYRYERIIEDIAAYCQQLLGSTEGDSDREQAYRWCMSNFQPGGEIEIARRTDSGWQPLDAH